MACLFNITKNSPELIIQYIILDPNHQNLGYGTQVLKELLSNPKEYFSHNITKVYTNIQKENVASLNLFRKFNFSFINTPSDYVRAQKIIKILEEEKI